LTLSQRLLTSGLIAATSGGVAFTVLVAGGSGSLDFSVIRQIYIGMAGISILPWLAMAIVKPSWRPASSLAPAILVFLVVFAISTITSRFPRLSAEMLGYAVLLTELYLILVALMRRPAVRLHFERLALVMAVLVAVLYVAEVAQTWLVWWDAVGRLAIPPLRPGYVGLRAGPNPIATVVLTFGAFGLATIGPEGRRRWLVSGIVVSLVLAATFLSGSRGAWLGAGLGLSAVILAAVFLWPDGRRRAKSMLRSRLAVVAVVVGAPLVAIAGALAALSGRLTLDDGGFRAGFARASGQMFEMSPLTGVGPGTWGVLRASNSVSPDPDLYIPHAHSIYWQTLAEFGLVGAIASVVMIAALGLLIFRAIRSGDPIRRRVGVAVLFILVLLAGQQFADMLMNVPAVLLALAIPVAWLDAAALPPVDAPADLRARRRSMGRAVPIGAAIATVLIIAGLARVEAVASIASQGVSAADDDAWPESARLSADAVAADAGVNLYRFQLGVSAANAGDLPLAERSLLESATTDDYRYAWLDLAAVRWQRGDLPGARDALARAERLGLQRTALALAAGWLRQELGDAEVATRDYATAILQLPTLADDSFWSSASGPPGGLAPILAAVEERADAATMLEIHLILGQFDLARGDAVRLESSDPAVYGPLIAAWQGDTQAWTRLQTEAANRPLDGGPAAWCRLIAAYRGDIHLVRAYGVWLALAGTPDSGRPPIGRLALQSTESLPVSFLDGYGSLYRRPVPGAQVVSPLPQLTLQEVP